MVGGNWCLRWLEDDGKQTKQARDKNKEDRYKYKVNYLFRCYNPSSSFLRPFIGVITPFITSRGPSCMAVSEIFRTVAGTENSPSKRELESQLVLGSSRNPRCFLQVVRYHLLPIKKNIKTIPTQNVYTTLLGFDWIYWGSLIWGYTSSWCAMLSNLFRQVPCKYLLNGYAIHMEETVEQKRTLAAGKFLWTAYGCFQK